MKIVLAFFLSSIFIMNSFGIGPNLYPLRLILPIALIYFFSVLFQKVFLLKQKIKLEPLVFFSLLFFVFMFLHTCLITFVRFELFNSSFEINSILNFIFLMFFILTLYFVIIPFRKEFLSLNNYIILIFYFLYAFFSLYEINTGNHLTTSVLFDAPSWARFVPTVVYFNSNDFAFVFTLMLMYILSVFDKNKSLNILWVLILFIIHMFIVYKSQSRLSILISFFYFILHGRLHMEMKQQ